MRTTPEGGAMKGGSDCDIACKFGTDFEGVPGFTAGSADAYEMNAAGWDRPVPQPGDAPMDELVVEGEQEITTGVADQMIAQARYHVLRDAGGKIVATWDEGRWWTPEESNS